jgi:hypothetical protein
MALMAAGDGIRAVDHQAHRIRHAVATPAFDAGGFQSLTEARFLILAIGWVRHACALVSRLLSDDALSQAGAQVWKATGVHNAKDMRDVWEHFDAYIVGDGQLQKPGPRSDGVAGPGSLGCYTWTGFPDSLGSLHWAGLSLSLDVAVGAAHDAYNLVTEASRTRGSLIGVTSLGSLRP